MWRVFLPLEEKENLIDRPPRGRPRTHAERQTHAEPRSPAERRTREEHQSPAKRLTPAERRSPAKGQSRGETWVFRRGIRRNSPGRNYLRRSWRLHLISGCLIRRGLTDGITHSRLPGDGFFLFRLFISGLGFSPGGGRSRRLLGSGKRRRSFRRFLFFGDDTRGLGRPRRQGAAGSP